MSGLLAFLLRYKEWLLIGLFVAAFFLAINYWKGRLIEQGRDEVRQEYVRQTLKATESARAKDAENQKRIDYAVAQSRKRAQTDQIYLAATNRTIDGLRQQLAIANSRMPTASSDAVREYASTLGTVFNDCVERYSSLEKSTSGHASDSLMLQQSWPK